MISQPLNIAAVHEDDQRGHDEAEQHGKTDRTVRRQFVGDDGVEHHADHRAERDIARRRDEQQKNNRKDEKAERIKRENHRRHGGNTLAAFEFEEDREDVPDHAEHAGKIPAERRAEQKRAEEHRDDRLEHIAEQRCRRCSLAVGAQHIGHARVAAAVLANVVVIENFGDHQGKVDAAEQVGHCDAEKHQQDEDDGCRPSFMTEAVKQNILKCCAGILNANVRRWRLLFWKN